MDADALHASVVAKYSEHVNPYLARLMNFAGFTVEVQGQGCTLIDHEGKEYLDCLGGYGVFSLGHRHPKVVEAVKRQLDNLPLSGKTFFSANQANLAERLADLCPGDINYAFFSNSGTEAVEAAMKFARAATGKTEFVSTYGGYHGKTMGALSLTGRAKYQERFQPLVPSVHFINFGDEHGLSKIDRNTAAFFIETVQGEGGIHVAPDGYLEAARRACDRVGALLVVDEVQTGLGRTGKILGIDHFGVQPDIITFAKALGGGVMPIGATMGTPQIWERVFSENPLLHTSTFGGNPLACAAGLATIEVIEEEGLCERATEMGSLLISGLRDLASRQDVIAEVRGQGLMIGVEFAMDEVGELVIAQMTKRGLIAAYTLNNPRVIRFEPPLIITKEQVEFAIRTFEDAVEETKEILAALA